MVQLFVKGRNPLDEKYERQLSYNALNRDGPVLVAQEAANVGVSKFVFISAAATFPGVPMRYLSSKR